ncbi:hypothetical protein GN956_G20805 [Arapaima gigas]
MVTQSCESHRSLAARSSASESLMKMNSVSLLLSVFFTVALCQNLTVLQHFSRVYLGDTLVLRCSGSGNSIKWYFNNVLQDQNAMDWILPIVSKTQEGKYSCERNGVKSEDFEMRQILDCIPPSYLSIMTGSSVVYSGDSVLLNLEVDKELEKWRCSAYKKGKLFKIGFQKDLTQSTNTNVSFMAQVDVESSPAIYWCSNTATRSNTISLRATDKRIKLVPQPDLPMLGREVQLRCMIHGSPSIRNVIFNQDTKTIPGDSQATYKITKMTKDNEGKYNCTASFSFSQASSQYTFITSEFQEVKAREPSMEATLSEDPFGLSCKCSRCPKQSNFYFYKHAGGQKYKQDTGANPDPGEYNCRAVWQDGASLLSNSVTVQEKKNMLLKVFAILLVLLAIAILVAVFIWRRKSRRPEPLYQEMPLGAVKSDKGDEGYEDLQKARTGTGDGGYETIKGERAKQEEKVQAGGSKPEGGYEALQADKRDKEAVYHTVGPEAGQGAPQGEGAKRAEGGYEALKTGESGGAVYHTLQSQGPQDEPNDDAKGEGPKRAEGGYEALKIAKGEENKGLYQTLASVEPKQE